ncbi:MAG: DNA gyrase subunit A [Peptoniphilaceae bacterium]|nr:DNA gyrase subunit A [Peptoniphilaceae bacterium]MDY3738526.1 DNA gyrase subunit A [Peptoniphilaceae bacterium]
MTEIQNDNIYNVDIEHEMKTSYLDYSMSVIMSRALPDVRDGLKPVHRRILYGMYGLGLTPDKATRKSARVVGEVMGKYHPHGDSAIYDAVVRLAQDFSTRYPLVHGQGNFGSLDGDGAAAMRYTEVKLTDLALEMMRDINKDTVDFIPNFDESEKEPVILPSRFPNLLVNGSNGIAVGMSTNMPPHNLSEVIDGVIEYIDNPEITIDKLNKIIKGPDFPTGANILGKSGIKRAYESGRGIIKLRATSKIEPFKKNRERIVFTDIPYMQNKAKIIIRIADLVKDKRIEGISDVRDESDRNGLRIVVELKRDANSEIVLNNLYKHTPLESSFGIINLALVDGVPKILNLKDLIHFYVEHQKEVVTRRTKYDLEKAKARKHIVEGLLIAIDNIDEIIKIIRSNYSIEETKKVFYEKFGLTDVQSQAILDMQLKRLSGLEEDKLKDEEKDLIAKIEYYNSILSSENNLLNLIKDELNEIKENYSDKRRTQIVADPGEFDIEELVEREDVLITFTHSGYIKRSPIENYKVQKRGGKGVSAIASGKEDYVESLITSDTHGELLFFTDLGKVYKIKAYEIPQASRTARGQAIVNILNLSKDEHVAEIVSLSKVSDEDQFVMATANGTIKKTNAENFKKIRTNGIIAIALKDNDKLISVKQISKETDLIITTQNGMAIRFSSSDVRTMGRQASGVKSIKLKDDDKVISMVSVDNNVYLLLVTENGNGKKTSLNNFKVQKRGGLGIRAHKVSEKSGKIVASIAVNIDEDIMLVSLSGDIIRISVRDVSTQGRNTKGVKLKDIVSDEDKIVSVTKYLEED